MGVKAAIVGGAALYGFLKYGGKMTGQQWWDTLTPSERVWAIALGGILGGLGVDVMAQLKKKGLMD